MTTAAHIALAIAELTRAKIVAETDQAYARARLNDARMSIAGAINALDERPHQLHRDLERERKSA